MTGMDKMIPRLFSVSLMLVALFFAGLPAFACAVGMTNHGCCPNEPTAPCGSDGSTLALQDLDSPCCAANVAASIVIGADDSAGESHRVPNRVDVPTLAVTSVVLPSFYLAGLKFQKSSTPYF